MTWQQIMDQARAVVKAHPGLQPEQYAALLQQQFRDVPILGWWVLHELEGTTPPPEDKEHGG